MSKKVNIEDLKRDHSMYKVPEGYFEGLTSKIQARVKEEEEVSDERVWIPRLAWIAPALVLVIGFFLFYPFNGQKSAEEILSEVSTEELINYLDMSDVSEEEILAYVDLEALGESFDDTSGELDLLDNLGEDELDGLLDDYNMNEEFL